MDFIQQNILLVGGAVVLVVAIISLEVTHIMRKYREVTPAQAVQLMNKEKAVILDLREGNELMSGTIQGAWHIAGSVLSQKISDLEKYKDKPVVAFCATGTRASKMCHELTKHGFEKIYHLKGGLAAWQQAGLPVVTK